MDYKATKVNVMNMQNLVSMNFVYSQILQKPFLKFFLSSFEVYCYK